MAFRRNFRRTFRRRRTRWDMQTFRLCEQDLQLKAGFNLSCNVTAKDFVKVLATSSGEVSGSNRAVMFGGGHLRVRYNLAVIDHDQCPCSHAVHVVSALLVLPLQEDNSTPAYLPELAISRTFDSVVAATNADNDENILWWHDYQLDATNLSCTQPPDNIGCGLRGLASNCGSDVDDINGHVGSMLESHSGALYGRMEVDHHVKVKRRIPERSALFFATEWFSNLGSPFNDCPTWPWRRNVYLRYAARPSR